MVALGVLAALGLVELSVRIATHSLFVSRGPDGRRFSITDPLLGHVPRPGMSFRHLAGFTITIGADGMRENGQPRVEAERPLTVAVGDSYTFGDRVNDDESWPAVLERILGQRVINAGAPGFGFDQTVLRAEQLAAVYAPDTIIVSFIPHDIVRSQMSVCYGRAKPYFDIDSSGLHLHAAPAASPVRFAGLKAILARSLTVELLVPEFLHWEGPDTMVHQRGIEVACLLMDRLSALDRAARVVVLAQPQQATARPGDLGVTRDVLACAKANDLLALDLFPIVERLQLAQRERLFDGHMTAEGNRLVARELAAFLARHPSP